MQAIAGGQRDTMHTAGLENFGQLPDTLLVCATGQSNEDTPAHHQNITAIDASGCHDVVDAPMAGKQRFDGGLFAATRRGAGACYDGNFRRHDGSVFDKAAVGKVLVCIEYPSIEELDEICEYNPLVFDYVVKRTIRDPERGIRFPASVFTGADLGPALLSLSVPGNASSLESDRR